ncbi:MAG: tpiA [Candidatus Saccharibacteria bacterium]|nr:tpiA [Candidatus Saccharibacteria bacterium]
MKKKLVVANWKMHLSTSEASILVHRLHEHIKTHRTIEVVLAPSMLTLQPISLEIDSRRFKLASQDGYPKDDGPYTGEVSFAMMRDLVDYSIIGHSARRIYFEEGLELIRDKVQAAVRNGITPILCVGETKNERAQGEAKRVIHDQVTSAVSNLTAEEIEKIVIAYEPIWAISTFDGEPSKPEDMQRAMEYIRQIIKELYGEAAASNARVLYGGSVEPHDARAYLSLPGCDGVLVGAASLNYRQFTDIVEIAYDVQNQTEDHA